MIVATVTMFSGTTTPDKNGEPPVMLQCMAGTMPNRNVLSGTVAKRGGFEVGKTYLVNVREAGYDDLFGPDYTWTKVVELTSGLDIVKAVKEVGNPHIQTVPRPIGFEDNYKRKGDAVEGQRTLRIKAGQYHPALQTTVPDYETAERVIEGTSTKPEPGVLQNQARANESEGPRDLPKEFYDKNKS